jgi:hypothetical protein
MNRKNILFLFLIVIMIVTINGCMPGSGASTTKNPAGFFTGVWHGWIAPISLIVGLFNPEVRVYESFNIGWWYDFGFYVAILGGFGGFSLFRKKKEN